MDPSGLFPPNTLRSRYVRLALALALLHCFTFIILESILLAVHSSYIYAFLQTNRTPVAIALIENSSALTADAILVRATGLTFYYSLFIVALLFQLVLFIDAVRNRNTIQIIGLELFHILTLGYCVIQIIQAHNIISSPAVLVSLQQMIPTFNLDVTLPISVTILCLMTLFVIAWTYFNYKLYQEFGWQVFKQIGADLRIRRMYMVYQVFVTILKFDVFMLLAFSTQWLIMLVQQASTPGNAGYGDFSQVAIHSVVSVGGSTIMLFVAYWAIRTERTWAMVLFIIADLATVGYFISKLVLMQPPYVTIGVQCTPGWPPNLCDRYDGSRNFFTLFLSVDIILGLVTAGIAIRALFNFGHGLLPHVDIRRKGTVGEGTSEGDTQLHPMEQSSTKRWTID